MRNELRSCYQGAEAATCQAEHEIGESGCRGIERQLVDVWAPTRKTFGRFDFDAVPMISKA
ncbi:hypothetical protein FXV83_40560 [Bradyrhizobium hipponense]|uniref:Uncharacterized protein n=1 Tax=Bradyrhizobium hipponense TaxID=2605638 RepID=A0A5S4YBY2_9BRAD|nr:hypothetical protein [Bradyrhizobium hipponense]TYO61007.1 hypothetical protein FXV83_40560 [Bradyrhizobium hipponense]